MEIFYLNSGKQLIKTSQLSNVDKRKLTWIRLLDHSDEKIKELSEFADIPKQEFDDFFEFEERSRLEQGRYLEITYQAPCYLKGEIETSTINFFIINNLFITVERDAVPSIQSISSKMKKNHLRFLFKRGVSGLLQHFLDKINDSFLYSIDKIANLTDILESRGANLSDSQLMVLYNYNVTLTRFNQAIIANLEVLSGLKKSYYKHFTKEDLEAFTDLYYEKLQILDTEKIQREVITNLFNFQTVVSSHRLNTFMKRLTSMALIVMVPTFITSLFGMNVPVPFANNPFAFAYILGGMMLFMIILYFIFRRLGWV